MQSFDELKLSPELMRSISELGYTTPSPIQAQALPILLGAATDFIGLAATGTGKTAAFGIPLLERLDMSKKGVQCLILCPTRELALQVCGQLNLLGKYKGVRTLPVYGGSSYSDQLHGLKRGVHIVVGTPGRVVDHLDRGTLKLDAIETVILDEADEMISMGFKEDLEKMLGAVPKDSSSIWLFSATMSREVRRVADEYLSSPKQVQVNRTEVLSQTVEQIYYVTQEANKPEVLCKIIDAADDFYGIVFCQTKSLVADLAQFLSERGYRVDSLHGDKDQNSRERTMQAFRERRVTLLICTDVASRGLDVKDVSHVVNYSIPRELDSYVHRIGRTARSGKAGLAISLVSNAQRGMISRIERLTKSQMNQGTIPTRRDLGAKKVAGLLPAFESQKSFDKAQSILSDSWKEKIKDMSKEEVVGRFLCLAFPEIFSDSSIERENEIQRHSEREQSSERQKHRGGPAYRGQGGGGGGRGRDDRKGPRGRPKWKDKKSFKNKGA